MKKQTSSNVPEAVQERVNKNYWSLYNGIQSDFVAQTKSVSDNARKIIWAILASVWVVCYKEGYFEIPNTLLVIASLGGFVYLAVDLVHYFCDSCFLFRKNNELYRDEITNEYLIGQNAVVHENTISSFVFLCIKFGFVFLIAVLFIIGLFILFLSKS